MYQPTVSNPISVNQIVDSSVNLKCIAAPECRTLPNDVQAIVDDYCSGKFDLDKIASKCVSLPNKADINVVLNEIFTKLCAVTTSTAFDINTAPLGTINFCDSDGWTVNDDNCIQPEDNCGLPILTYSTLDLFRLIIKRIVAIENVVKTLSAQNGAQQTQINTLIATTATIQSTCCNTSILGQVQTILSRLNAAGIP
jgi:hypothetical protein